MMKSIFLFILIVTIFFPSTLVMAGEHQRDKWYIGFGLGGILDSKYEGNGNEGTLGDWLKDHGSEEDIALNLNLIKVGFTLSRKLLLGLDCSANSIQKIGSTSSSSSSSSIANDVIQVNNYFIVLTYFPLDEGFFMKGGGGYSTLPVSVSSTAITSTATGYGFLGGIGYAFWLGKGFNLTLNLDQSRQFYSGSDEFKNSQCTVFYLGFDWY